MQKVAIVDTTGRIPFVQLQIATVAFQIQVSQHLQPHWLVDAELTAYITQDEIPADAWPVLIKEALAIDVYGYHSVDANKKPFAVLKYRDDWTHTVSHELMEMLVDPYGDRVLSGEVFAENAGEEQILVEVADPSQNISFGYDINGIRVSDFYFPAYFEPYKIEGKRYSYTGIITEPRTLADGGYISFKDRFGDWWQAFKTQNEIVFKKISTGESLTVQDKGRVARGFAITLFVLGALGFIIGIILRIINNRRQ